jgi:hypothetical protein
VDPGAEPRRALTVAARPWWAHLRTAFVVVHLVAVSLCAFPSIGSAGLVRGAWKQPTVQGEFRAWAARLQAVGLPITAEALEEHGWTFANAFESTRRVVLWPFEPYYRYCGTWQSWKMFVAPHRFPTRVEIAIDHGAGFEVVYLARDPELRWHAEWFDHDRFRSVLFRMGWPQYKALRRNFLDFVAERAAAEFPDATRVRVAFLRSETPTPAETVAGVAPEVTRELQNTKVLRREGPP